MFPVAQKGCDEGATFATFGSFADRAGCVGNDDGDNAVSGRLKEMHFRDALTGEGVKPMTRDAAPRSASRPSSIDVARHAQRPARGGRQRQQQERQQQEVVGRAGFEPATSTL